MKTLRIALLSLVVAASGAATFAGPGPQYWAVRRAEQATKKTDNAPVSVSKEQSGASCDTMVVKQGKRTGTVKCDSTVADTAKCKAACGS